MNLKSANAELRRCYAGDGPDGRPGWWFAVGYDADLIEMIKRVPRADRAWNPQRVEWWISREHEALLRRLVPKVALYLDQPRLL